MEVILLEKVRNLGGLGDQVSVKPGYGRNYLIPQGKAVSATTENIAKFEAQRAELERIAMEVLAKAKERADALSRVTITIAANAGEEGKLFGSIGIYDLAEAITKEGVAVEKSEIHLPHGPIRELGEYEVDVQLHSDVVISVKVEVISA